MIIIFSVVALILDIISKVIVSKFISLGENIIIINSFLSITNVRNSGVAWSMFADKNIFVLMVSALVILGIIMYVYKNRPKDKVEEIAYSIIIGGALGNFLNRLFYGYVVDFISVKIFGYGYPIFNLADSFIVIGVIILIIYTWRCSGNGDKSR